LKAFATKRTQLSPAICDFLTLRALPGGFLPFTLFLNSARSVRHQKHVSIHFDEFHGCVEIGGHPNLTVIEPKEALCGLFGCFRGGFFIFSSTIYRNLILMIGQQAIFLSATICANLRVNKNGLDFSSPL
jgi:hypothetical protein